MWVWLPADVIKFVRDAFEAANRRATLVLTRQPSMHEENLDQQIITALDEVGSRIMPRSGAAVAIETHWLGGRRHFGAWEIADVAVAIIVRRTGTLIVRKVALLQSKRLYSREIPVREEDKTDYMIGIGRLINRTDPVATLTKQRTFAFADDCVYGALVAGKEQPRRIDEYVKRHNIPVYYSLYNPARVPMTGMFPQLTSNSKAPAIEVGCRVLTSVDVHGVLAAMRVGQRPKFAELVRAVPAGDTDPYSKHGWRLGNFIADEVLRCREGRLFDRVDDVDLDILLTGRTAPISAAIVITIDLPGGD
jgi:hypothetical protein